VLFLLILPLLFCLPAFAVTLKVVRPEPAEALAISEGRTFVIGTVDPADSSVTCNGVKCDVSEDGAFIGFVPIRRTDEMVEEREKKCDAMFHFVARSGEDETSKDVPTYTPKSPSAAEPPEKIFDPPRWIRLVKNQFIGLEGERLGEIWCAPKGAVMKSARANQSSYRCKVHSDIEVGILKSDFEEIENGSSSEDRSEGFVIRADVKSIAVQGAKGVEVTSAGSIHYEDGAFQGVYRGFKVRFDKGLVKLDERVRGKGRPFSDDPDKPLKDLRVCLDPGHHPDSGAVGPRGLEERISNLLIARQTAKLLEAEGAKVSFSREENPLPLKQRHDRMRELNPDLVVSIHNNSVGDGQDPREKHGTQTFWLFPWSKPLAESIHKAMLKHLETTDMGCIRRNLYIPRFPDCPTILIEPEYIILPNQEKKFMDAEYREKLAGAIVEGIRNFILYAAGSDKGLSEAPEQGKKE